MVTCVKCLNTIYLTFYIRNSLDFFFFFLRGYCSIVDWKLNSAWFFHWHWKISISFLDNLFLKNIDFKLKIASNTKKKQAKIALPRKAFVAFSNDTETSSRCPISIKKENLERTKMLTLEKETVCMTGLLGWHTSLHECKKHIRPFALSLSLDSLKLRVQKMRLTLLPKRQRDKSCARGPSKAF